MDSDHDNLIARLCADYLDYLNGVGGRNRAQVESIPVTPTDALRLREALDQIDEFRTLVRVTLEVRR